MKLCKVGLHRWRWEFVQNHTPDWPNEWLLRCHDCQRVWLPEDK